MEQWCGSARRTRQFAGFPRALLRPKLARMASGILDQQKLFAEHYVLSGGSAAAAARQAGYSPGGSRQSASRLLALPHVQAEIRRQQTVTLRGRLASKALNVLEGILDDPDAPPGVRVDAAKTILDRAGLSAARTPDAASDDDVPLESLTLAELERIAGQLKAALTEARTIPGEAQRVEPESRK